MLNLKDFDGRGQFLDFFLSPLEEELCVKNEIPYFKEVKYMEFSLQINSFKLHNL